MKITAEKIKKELHKNYGYGSLEGDFATALIQDTLKVVDTILRFQKGVSIKNKKTQ